MEALNIEPTYRVLWGDAARFRIMLVGCGGTGSALAPCLASLAYHAGQKGVQAALLPLADALLESPTALGATTVSRPVCTLAL